MDYEWDENKNEANRVKHGVDFSLAVLLDWQMALVASDEKPSKGELRYTALGFIGDRLYVCIYTWRSGARRIISLRKANNRERKAHK